jgi:predicted RNase H-like nuclease (RuvC/YqgF family)
MNENDKDNYIAQLESVVFNKRSELKKAMARITELEWQVSTLKYDVHTRDKEIANIRADLEYEREPVK